MKIEVWSDIACPWCYIGKVRFEKALAAYEHAGEVAVVWRSFQLQPDAPRIDPPLTAQHLAEKYGIGLAQALEMMERVTEVAAGEGLAFHLERAVAGNTFDAHRLVHHAAGSPLTGDTTALAATGAEQAQDTGSLGLALMKRLMHAYQSEGANVADHETLLRLAEEVGLDRVGAARVLASDAHAEDVRADFARGRAFGVSGVPFFVIDEQHGISGAQPTALFLQALRQLGPQQQPLSMFSGAAADGGGPAPVCDDDGCAVPQA